MTGRCRSGALEDTAGTLTVHTFTTQTGLQLVALPAPRSWARPWRWGPLAFCAYHHPVIGDTDGDGDRGTPAGAGTSA
ncbi:MAG TPA: hypothetical protein VED63_13455 [Acidimicrobiales bacterium]|nr:hypothetical protein [Acidimicrobiales bacterium]